MTIRQTDLRSLEVDTIPSLLYAANTSSDTPLGGKRGRLF